MISGLALVDKYYQDYGNRARELKAQGQKIIGYLCSLVPIEIIAAAGLVPFKIKGDVNEPITQADTQLETIACPLVRSCFDVALKGRYEFLDGLVMPHACDSICRTYRVWKYNLGLPYSHLINTPHLTDSSSMEFYKQELNTFRKSLGRFVGAEISDKSLSQAIQAYNQNRAKVRELYEFRKPDPPLISGMEITKVLVASLGLPVEESTELISNVIDEIKKRASVPVRKSARIMVVGSQIDATAFIDLIESSDASVVMDDLCVGSRDFWPYVDTTDDPMDGIAEHYLRGIGCSRSYRERKGTQQEYLEERFGHLGNYAKDFKVDGVILYIYRYCDPFGFDVPAIKSYVESLNIPVLYLEDEYSMLSIGRLRTRVQAFLEMMG